MKLVINTCFGGFGLSEKAMRRYFALNAEYVKKSVYAEDIPRDDPHLVRVVEELGEAANGPYASLSIVEIPDGVEWQIEEYDGNEHVAKKHRTWE